MINPRAAKGVTTGFAVFIIAILTSFAATQILYPLLFFIFVPVVIIVEVAIIRVIERKNKNTALNISINSK